MPRVLDTIRNFIDAVPRPRQRLPLAVQFPINDICNSRCRMCHIWEQKRDVEISPESIRKVLANRLFRRVRSVGINGGEPTLRTDFADAARAVVESLPRLRNISLITNAVAADKVNAAIDELSVICRDHGVALDVMVSLDGVGGVHDRVRGREGNFTSAVQVLDHVQQSDLVDTCRIGCTVVKENVYDVENVLAWCEDRNLYARFRLGIPHPRLYTSNLRQPFDLDEDEVYHFAVFLDHLYHDYEKSWPRRVFYRSLRDQLVYGAPRRAGCLWKHAGVTLTPRGELAYCAVKSRNLGDAVHGDANRLYWDHADHLREIVETECDSCRHDYEGLADRRLYLRRLASVVSRKVPPSIYRRMVGGVQWWSQRTAARRALGSSSTPAAVKQSADAEGRPRRLLIIGWYGTETLGDKAILGGVVISARDALGEDLACDVASLEPFVTRQTQRQMPGLRLRSVLGIEDARRAIEAGQYDLVAVGGGPLMSTITECATLLELLKAARRRRMGTVIAGCGVGPLPATPMRRVIAELLHIADRVVLRDSASVRVAREVLGVEREMLVAADPALIWIQAHRSALPAAPSASRKVLLALRRWTPQEYARDLPFAAAEAVQSRFESEVRAFAGDMLRRDWQLKPLAMHKYAVGGDDRFYLSELFRNDDPRIAQILDARQRSPEEELRQFESAHAVLAMRFHSVVFALACRRPFLAIDYTRGGKIKGLLEDLDLSDRLIKLAEFDGAAAARRLSELSLQENAHTAPDVSDCVAAARRRLCATFTASCPGRQHQQSLQQ